MTILYDQSAAFEGLVLGTSNKSELLLGYGTQFGDMASALNPIGDLYKTQLRHLAAHLRVPEAILKKSPSGDLWIGQTDEDELGFSYAEVDRLLVLLVDRRWQADQLVRAGFAADFVEQRQPAGAAESLQAPAADHRQALGTDGRSRLSLCPGLGNVSDG